MFDIIERVLREPKVDITASADGDGPEFVVINIRWYGEPREGGRGLRIKLPADKIPKLTEGSWPPAYTLDLEKPDGV